MALLPMMRAEEPTMLDGAMPTSLAPARTLDQMVRDPRYWRDRDHDFIARVTEGFTASTPADPAARPKLPGEARTPSGAPASPSVPTAAHADRDHPQDNPITAGSPQQQGKDRSMSASIDQAFVKQFQAEVHEAYQRQGSKLRPTVRSKTDVSGASTVFQKVGKGTAAAKARNGMRAGDEHRLTPRSSASCRTTTPATGSTGWTS